MVPLEDKYLVLDLMEDMALPVLVVARSGLGTINHTLLTINACRSRDLQVVGVIMNGYQADKATLAEETNPRVIAELGQVNILTVIPYDKESSVEKGRLGDDAYAATGLVNWVELLSKKAK
jgi:dethiobiotin synthetase